MSINLNYIIPTLLAQKRIGNAKASYFLEKILSNKDYKEILKSEKEYSKKSRVEKLIPYEFIQKAISESNKTQDILENAGLSTLLITDNSYPTLLKEIYNPPVIIYYRGEVVNLAKPSVSIVGSRKISEYGKKYAAQYANEISLSGITVVSGLAYGIDSVAHKSSLFNEGRTIAVLASSPDNITPASQSDLANEILNNSGTILSDIFPGTKINPYMFAARNRIVAGLSSATIVIEAGRKSGAKITADLAMESNREVFALPGRVDSIYSEGCNDLIRENKAILLSDINQVLDMFKLKSKKYKKDELLPEEEIIYSLILSGTTDADTLALKSQIDFVSMINICTQMEYKGIIHRDNLGNYSI